MVKVHYGNQTFELPAGYDVERELRNIELVRSSGRATVAILRLPLASGGVLAMIISDYIPVAFEIDPADPE